MTDRFRTSRGWLAALAAFLLLILIAGLAPFRAPKNQVEWVGNGGLHFRHYGSALSTTAFQGFDADKDGLGTLEVWLKPDLANDTHTILAFEGDGRSEPPFAIAQSETAFGVRRHNIDEHGVERIAVFRVPGVLHPQRPVFVTVVLKKNETWVYVDGSLIKKSPILGASTNNFTGRLVLANSPALNDSWPGTILGVAVYRRDLPAEEVATHYANWKMGNPRLNLSEDGMAMYLFKEQHGTVAHNEVGNAGTLTIPPRYFVLHPPVLMAPWRPYRFGWPHWTYWEDIAVNIAGFVPFGFLLFAYLSPQNVSRPLIVAIGAGFLLSLTIESLQGLLPTRDSDMTDVITNTLGTAVGALSYRIAVRHGLWPMFQKKTIAPVVATVSLPVSAASEEKRNSLVSEGS